MHDTFDSKKDRLVYKNGGIYYVNECANQSMISFLSSYADTLGILISIDGLEMITT